MLKIMQKYLAYNFLPAFLGGTFFFVTFLMTFQVFRILAVFISKGLPISSVFGLMWHIAISFLPSAVPLALFFSIIYALNKLADDSELIAMRSFGMSKWQILTPFLVFGVVISLLVYVANKNLIPASKRVFANTVIQFTSKGLLSEIKAEKFFTEIPNVTLFAQQVHGNGSKFENIFLQMRSKNGQEEDIIFARKGVLIRQKDGNWEIPNLRLHLMDGNIVKTYRGKEQVDKTIFGEYDFPVLSGDYRPGFITKDSMRTSDELHEVLKEKRALGVIDRDFQKTELEYWWRINTPLQCLVFVVLGFALGMRQGPRVQGNNVGKALIFMIAYYSLLFLGISLTQKMVLDAAVSTFLPSILAVIVGINIIRKLDWV